MAGDPITDLYDAAPAAPETLRQYQPFVPARSSSAGAFARNSGRQALPTAGGIAAFPAGAGAGAAAIAPIAAVSGPAAPFVEGAGALAGGLATAFGAGWAIEKGQDALLSRMPIGVQEFLGQDLAQRQADEAEHPTASFLGSLAPQLAFMRPSFSLSLGARAVGATIAGGVEAGSEYAQTGKVDPFRVAAQAAGGALLDRPTRLGTMAMAPGHQLAANIPTGAGITAAVQGARDTLAGVREAGLSKLYETYSPERLRAMQRAGTLDDRALAEGARSTWGDEHLTPDEQAASSVLEHNAAIAERNPLQPGPIGAAAYGDRVSATMQAILAGDPLPDLSPAGGRAALLGSTSLSAGDAIATARANIAAHESGHAGYAARNPLPGQTASGKYQFTDGTWLGLGRQLDRGKSDAEIMAAKGDPATQERYMDAALGLYARQLRGSGLPITPGNLYMLHFLGPTGLSVLHADAAMPIEAIVSGKAIAANRSWLAGKTAGELVADMSRRAGGVAPEAVPLGDGSPVSPADYLDRVAAGEGAGDAPAGQALQRYAADNQEAIAAEAQDRLPMDARPADEGASDWDRMAAGRDRYQRDIGDLWQRPLAELEQLHERALEQERADLRNVVELAGVEISDRLRSRIENGNPEHSADLLRRVVEDKFGDQLPDEIDRLLSPRWEDHQAGDLPNASDIEQLIKAHGAGANDALNDEHMLASEIGWALRDLEHGDIAAVSEGGGSIPAQAAVVTLREGYASMRARGVDSAEMPQRIYEAMVRNGVDPGIAAELTQGQLEMLRADAPPPEPSLDPEAPALPETRLLAGPAGEDVESYGAGAPARSAIARFDDPAGEGAAAQVESLEHDLRMEIAVPASIELERKGDFWEATGDDAVKIAKALDIVAYEGRDGVMRVGIPEHVLDNWRGTLADQGIAVHRQGDAPAVDAGPDFRLDDEGGEHSLADILRAADEEDAALDRIRACLPPAGAGA